MNETRRLKNVVIFFGLELPSYKNMTTELLFNSFEWFLCEENLGR